MTEDLRASLEAIRQQTPRLNEATDRLAQVVKAVEDFLNDECRLSLKVRVTIASNYESGPEFTTLEYRKIGSRFRIAVVDYDAPGEISGLKAWSECSRDVKVWAFRCLPGLLKTIVTEVQKETADIEIAAQEARKTVQSLRSTDSSKASRQSASEGDR